MRLHHIFPLFQIIDVHQQCLYKTLRAGHKSVSFHISSKLVFQGGRSLFGTLLFYIFLSSISFQFSWSLHGHARPVDLNVCQGNVDIMSYLFVFQRSLFAFSFDGWFHLQCTVFLSPFFSDLQYRSIPSLEILGRYYYKMVPFDSRQVSVCLGHLIKEILESICLIIPICYAFISNVKHVFPFCF